MEEPTMAECFRLVASVLREKGWSYGRERGPRGEVCLVVALEEVTQRYETEYWTERDFLADSIGCYSLSQWNDTPGRTVDDVLDALERAAQLAEAS